MNRPIGAPASRRLWSEASPAFGERRTKGGRTRELAGETPAHHGLRRGFTLIELIVVMALLLIVVGVSYPSLRSFFSGRVLDSEARRFLSLTRYAQSRAASEGVPMVLWIDADEGTYGLQAEAGFLDLDRKAVEYELDETLSVEVSAPPAARATAAGTGFGTGTGTSLTQRQRTAAASANLPAIRISAEGYLEEISPEAIEFRHQEFGEARSAWIVQTGNRLNYEISQAPPVNLRSR